MIIIITRMILSGLSFWSVCQREKSKAFESFSNANGESEVEQRVTVCFMVKPDFA